MDDPLQVTSSPLSARMGEFGDLAEAAAAAANLVAERIELAISFALRAVAGEIDKREDPLPNCGC